MGQSLVESTVTGQVHLNGGTAGSVEVSKVVSDSTIVTGKVDSGSNVGIKVEMVIKTCHESLNAML